MKQAQQGYTHHRAYVHSQGRKRSGFVGHDGGYQTSNRRKGEGPGGLAGRLGRRADSLSSYRLYKLSPMGCWWEGVSIAEQAREIEQTIGRQYPQEVVATRQNRETTHQEHELNLCSPSYISRMQDHSVTFSQRSLAVRTQDEPKVRPASLPAQQRGARCCSCQICSHQC
ncbi:hypothetical protein GN956_G1558 [Arapaima gigas]